MRRMLTHLAAAAMLAAASPYAADAEVPNNLVKIGVLTDMSGPFADQVGAGSVAAARLAAEDFAGESHGLKVEILFADHQNKPDIGSAQARKWVDDEGVAAVVDLPKSAVGLSVNSVMRERNRVELASSTATSDLTGKACSPTTVQWTLDTWALGRSTATALLQSGGNKWFFLTVDYALGHALERDATAAVTAGGGQVLGAVKQPLGTADFSSALLQAQASGANVLALANTGADAINAIKQAGEFGLSRTLKLAALFMQISDVHSVGLEAAHGLLLAEAFYWDLNDATRAFTGRFSARMPGRVPTEDQAGVYSSTLAYLRAVRDAGTIDGDKVVAQMRSHPIEDALFGHVVIRPDGRAVHDMYLFRVKPPAASKQPWDVYEKVQTIPGDTAFRPLQDGGCPLVK